MPLPSSGQISMSDINTEASFASTKANSSTAIRTADYAFAGVNQAAPFAFSEFHGKTYALASDSATLFYYYPFDGGNGYNNPQVLGWDTAAAAEAHVPLNGPWTHTVYFTGSLANGTLLWCDQDPAAGRYQALIDQGGAGGYSGFYYIEYGVQNYTCSTSTNTPTFTISSLVLLPYIISWSYSMTANSGVFQISENASLVVNISATNSNTFTSIYTDDLDVYIESNATFPLDAGATLSVVDDGTSLYNNTATFSGFVTNSYGPWSPTGPNTVSGTSYEF